MGGFGEGEGVESCKMVASKKKRGRKKERARIYYMVFLRLEYRWQDRSGLAGDMSHGSIKHGPSTIWPSASCACAGMARWLMLCLGHHLGSSAYMGSTHLRGLLVKGLCNLKQC